MKKAAVAAYIVLLAYEGLVLAQIDDSTCDVESAKPCLQARELEYKDYTSIIGGEAPTQTLCLTQVKSDKNEDCFKIHTQLCSTETAATIQQKWDTLNADITSACQKFCPDYTDIVGCKQLVESDGLGDSKFERFCSTFNQSLTCANTALKGCIYGQDIYMQIHPLTVTSYWQNICQSGCQNIDQTVEVISKCLEPFATVNRRDIAELCRVHEEFKTCISESTVVCDEVMKLILFKHKAYNRLEIMCKPATTAPPPTTTTLSTTTTTTLSTTTTTIQTTEAESEPETTTVLSNDSFRLDLPKCLPFTELQMFLEMKELNQEQLIRLLKIDECLHMAYDTSELPYFLETLPEGFSKAYHQAKQRSYIIVQRLISSCHADQQACNSRLESRTCNAGTTIASFTNLLTFLSVVLAARWFV